MKIKNHYFLISSLIHVFIFLSFGFSSRASVPQGFQRAGEAIVVVDLGNESVGVLQKKMVSPSPSQSEVLTKEDVTVTHKKKDKDLDEIKSPSTVSPGSESSSEPQFGVQRGLNGSGPLGQKNGSEVTAKARYLYELRLLLEQRKIYPRLSRQMRESGRVGIQFEVLLDGKIENVAVISSSASSRLDQAALDLVKTLGRYRPLPHDIHVSSLKIEVPIEYKLN